MNTMFPPQTMPATPEYVLSVIVDNHRQQSQFDIETDAQAVLKFSSTVAEWRFACDLIGWRNLGRALNKHWAIDCSDQQWKAVLHPPAEHTLREVCDLIAAHAVRPVIRPITLLGRPCLKAGAFLTVRHLLSQAGANAGDIGPSTPLSPFLRRFPEVFLGPVSLLAPGALPPVKIRRSFHDALLAGFVISLLLTGVDLVVGRPEWAALCAALCAVCAIAFFVLAWFSALWCPRSMELGDLKTFRDLAGVLASTEVLRSSG